MTAPAPPLRVVVTGPPGSGKTTVARARARETRFEAVDGRALTARIMRP